MKLIYSITTLFLVAFSLQANARLECVYSCGSRGQEQVRVSGWNERHMLENLKAFSCKRYEGGVPKYRQSCQQTRESDQRWQCVYSCGSRGQETKVGQGWSREEAMFFAQESEENTCRRYEGGKPKYLQSCRPI